ncbi:MAG: DNA-protecting protein DprA [Candidatus Omnitrophica bacterium]|nr:DNA-protecting protein DprA [Candidatus Omnitrophota bacterium]
MKSSLFCPKTNRDALLILNAISGLGNRRTLALIQHFGSPQSIFESLGNGSLRSVGLPEQLIINMETFDAETFLKSEEDCLLEHDARLMTILDDDYPSRLKEIADAPIVLYIQGKIPERLDCAIAIVGSRNATIYGLQMAEQFARELSELGVPIISGLARGIDAAAHRGCLRASGQTVGVLGCGLDIVYPRENKFLFDAIREKGCIISEFPFGTPPVSYNFPRRNRIVSGLSLGVLVVEANLKSGALITADFALEQGREVFALPGRVDSPLSQGPHAIIRQGAKLVLSVDDILEELPVKVMRPESAGSSLSCESPDLDNEEKELFDIIKEGKSSLESLQVKTGSSSSGLMAPLLALQLKKIVRELPGKIYELVSGR